MAIFSPKGGKKIGAQSMKSIMERKIWGRFERTELNLLLFSLTNALIRSWNIESYHPCVNKVETKTKQDLGGKRIMGRYMLFKMTKGYLTMTYLCWHLPKRSACFRWSITRNGFLTQSVTLRKVKKKWHVFFQCFTEYNSLSPPGTDRNWLTFKYNRNVLGSVYCGFFLWTWCWLAGLT